MPILSLPHRPLSARLGAPVQLLAGLGLALAGALAFVGPSRLIAQIEGERGIAPIASSGDIETRGIDVDVQGKDAQDARLNGWREAYKKAWEQLKGPDMPLDQIEGMVSAVVVEREQLGPRRYIARLGVIFDRSRAGQFVGGVEGTGARSAPLLVIPVLHSGGAAQVFEVRGPWQRAWAEFVTGASAIDYVRPNGGGGESLLITAGQTGRRSRIWWRNILDQFNASDVIMPVARLERQWPGGPVRGEFVARYGPDDKFLQSFTMTARNEAALPAMLAQAVKRFDAIYTSALDQGILTPDATLNIKAPELDPAIAALIEAGRVADAQNAAERRAAAAADSPSVSASPSPSASPSQGPATTFTVQFDSPDAGAVDMAVGTARRVAGVQSASTSSIAIGGTSVMRVSFTGDIEALATQFRARGYQVTVSGNALSIRR